MATIRGETVVERISSLQPHSIAFSRRHSPPRSALSSFFFAAAFPASQIVNAAARLAMDRIDLLQIFARAARLGSFTLAAESLDLSRASVSRAVQSLEASLGRRLFNRTTRTVTLTAEGEALLEKAQRLLDDADAVFRPPESDEAALSGRLRIASSTAFAEFFLAEALEAFRDRHPAVIFELLADVSAGSPLTPQHFAEARLDAAFCAAAEPHEALVAVRAGLAPSVLCAAPGAVPEEALRGLEDADEPALLRTLPLIPTGAPAAWRLRRASDGRTCVVKPSGGVAYSNAHLALSSALRGRGIAMLPAVAVREALADGRLLRVLPRWAGEPEPILAVFASRRQIAGAAAALLAFVRERLAADRP